MRSLGFLVQLLLASAAASATAGLLALILLLGVATAENDGGMTAGGTLFALLFGFLVGGLAIVPAVMLLTIPTMIVGGSLWLLARSGGPARRPVSFALAGAMVGGIGYPLLLGTGYLGLLADPGALVRTEWIAMAVFPIAGACSGLVFRSAMLVLGTFFGEEFEEEDLPAGRNPAP